MSAEFVAFPKIPRFNRDVTITEKIDGTNACVVVVADPDETPWCYAQSRKRIITPESDNFGFAAWVQENADELVTLGAGHHYGEWYGRGIQRNYGLEDRRFALFNVDRWAEDRPECCDVVPVLRRTTGEFLNHALGDDLAALRHHGSYMVPGFTKPEGLVIFHHAANQLFKVLLEGDEIPKGLAA